MQVMEKTPSKVLLPDASKIQDIAILTANYAIPYVKSKGDTSTKMIDRRTIQDVGRRIPIYPDPVHRLCPKPVKTSIPDVL